MKVIMFYIKLWMAMALTLFGVEYLLFSFVEANINFQLWAQESRNLMSLVWCGLMFVLSMALISTEGKLYE